MNSIMEANLFSLENIVKRRAGHVVVSYEDELYMWGGYMEEELEGTYNLMTTQLTSHFHDPDEIWIYSPFLNIWRKRRCTGDIPLKLSGSCAGVLDHYMYVFGGFNDGQINDSSQNILWRLDLISFIWECIVPLGFKPFASDKSASWVFYDRFYIFGGYGPDIYARADAPPVPVAYETESELTSKGWLDQLAYYDSSNNCWVWPQVRGLKPSPRAAHAAAVLKHKAFIFGGRHKENRLNDFHCLDLETHRWSTVALSANCAVPRGRSWHTLNTISDDKIILYGGFSSTCQVLKDIWIFNTKSMTWEQLSFSNYSKRLWHCGALTGHSEIVYLGGISTNILNYTQPKRHAEDMQRIRLSPPPLFELAMDYVIKSKSISQNSWVFLPIHIKKILEVRTDPFEIHGLPVK